MNEDELRKIYERRGRWVTKLLVADFVFLRVVNLTSARSLSPSTLVGVMSKLHDALWDTRFLASLVPELVPSTDPQANPTSDCRRQDRVLKEWMARQLDGGQTLDDLSNKLSVHFLSHPFSRADACNFPETAEAHRPTTALSGDQSAATWYNNVVQYTRKKVSFPEPWVPMTQIVPNSEKTHDPVTLMRILERLDVFNRLQFRCKDCVVVDVRAVYCHADKGVQDLVLADLPEVDGPCDEFAEAEWYEFVEDVPKWRREIARDDGRRTVDFRPFIMLTRLQDLRRVLSSESGDDLAQIRKVNKMDNAKCGFAKISRQFLRFVAEFCVIVPLHHMHQRQGLHGATNVCVWGERDIPPNGTSQFQGLYDGELLDATNYGIIPLTGEEKASRAFYKSSDGPVEFYRRLAAPEHAGAAITSIPIEPYLAEVRVWLAQPPTERLVLSLPRVDSMRQPHALAFLSATLRSLRRRLSSAEFTDRISVQPQRVGSSCQSDDIAVELELRHVESPEMIAERLVAKISATADRVLVKYVTRALNPATNGHFEYLGDAVLDFISADRAARLVVVARAGDNSGCVEMRSPSDIGIHVSESSSNNRLCELLPDDIRKHLVNRHFLSSKKSFADTVEAIAGALFAAMRIECGSTIDEALDIARAYAAFIGL